MKKVENDSSKETEANIEAYLMAHPNFFQGRQTLLDSLFLAEDKGNTISLIARQTENLRKKNTLMREKLRDLLTAAEANNKTFDRCKSLILTLISCDDSEEFFSAIEDSFKHEFKSTSYSLILFGTNERRINHFTSVVNERHVSEDIKLLTEAENPIVGVLRSLDKDFLFGPTSNKVKSSVILAIRNQAKLIGIFSVGSKHEGYFEPDQGTNFIGFLGEVLGILIPRLLEK